jgi:ELWxxDGT repeat protein
MVLVKDTVGTIDGMLGNAFFTSYMKSLPTPPYYEIHYWKSDGTAGGTVRVSDSLGKAASFTVLNNKMYSASQGTALWESDGTEAGTKNLITGIISYPTVFNNTIFFSNWGTGTGYEVWSVTPTATGIMETHNQQAQVLVYPNPSTGMFNVNLQGNEPATIKVFDLQGREILQQVNSTVVDLSGHPQGVYFMQISTASGTRCQKILLAH